MIDFPLMLYRKIEEGEAFDFENPKNVKTVSTVDELEESLDAGWLANPTISAEDEEAVDHDSEEKRLREAIEEVRNRKKPETLAKKIKRKLGV